MVKILEISRFTSQSKKLQNDNNTVLSPYSVLSAKIVTLISCIKMYDDELLVSASNSSQQASPASQDENVGNETSEFPKSKNEGAPTTSKQTAASTSSASSFFNFKLNPNNNNKLSAATSIDDIVDSYYQKFNQQQNSATIISPFEASADNSKDDRNAAIKKASTILHNDPQLIQQLGTIITKRAVQNRDAIRKGVISFSKSTAYLTSQLSRGPLSDHDIKWLEVGLVANQPSPIRDSLFKIEEVLVDVGKTLEGIEAASERYALAKKRREMLVEQRDKLLRIAASRQKTKRSESPTPQSQPQSQSQQETTTTTEKQPEE